MWLRDPIEYFFTTADDQVDCFFMDDGARSARYTPLYTNSGFYFIRNNMRTQFFMHRMLMAYDTVLAVRSHQHALICVEIIAVALNLRVDLDAIDATIQRDRAVILISTQISACWWLLTANTVSYAINMRCMKNCVRMLFLIK